MSRSPSTPDPDDGSTENEKMALFCRDCGHRSSLDGDWLVREGADGYRIVCPNCGTVIIDQPVFGAFA